MQRLAVLFLGLVAVSSTVKAADQERASLELRISPPVFRESSAPSLCPMFAVPVTGHWLVGGGYELVQDYDAAVRTSYDTLETPLFLSGIRLGGWYRGSTAHHHAISFAIGGLVTLSHPSVSIIKSPSVLDNGTYIFDFGLDLSVGYVWDKFRLELFALPAWSLGHISTSATPRPDRWSGFTPRVGVALAFVIR